MVIQHIPLLTKKHGFNFIFCVKGSFCGDKEVIPILWKEKKLCDVRNYRLKSIYSTSHWRLFTESSIELFLFHKKNIHEA